MKRLILTLLYFISISFHVFSQDSLEFGERNMSFNSSFNYYNGENSIRYDVDLSSIFLVSKISSSISELKAIQGEFINNLDIDKIYKFRGNAVFIRLEGNFTIESYFDYVDILRKSGLFEFVNPTYFSTEQMESVSYSNSLILHSEDINSSPNALKLKELGFKIDEQILLPKYFYKFDLKFDLTNTDLVDFYLLLTNYSTFEDHIYIDFYHKVKLNSDPYFYKQWYLSNNGLINLNDSISLSSIEDADIDGPEAWLITKGSSEIKVAVLDVGVDYENPDLNDNIVTGFDAITTDIVGYEVADGQCLPWDYHGTGCAGIIAAEENIFGGVGVAPYVKIIPVRIGYSLGIDDIFDVFSSESAWSNALIWCDSIGDVDIISCSMSKGTTSPIIDAAINQNSTEGRDGMGIIQIFSAGNDNHSPVSYPSKLESVISVGATTLNDRRKSPDNLSDLEPFWGSNYGFELDIVAPGINMLTTDVVLQDGFNYNVYVENSQVNSTYEDIYGEASECFSSINSNYNNIFNGTSASAPVVAGVCALILSLDNSLSYTQVREILEGNCDKIDGYSYSDSPSHPNGTWSYEMGYGRVNAYKALLAVQEIEYGCGDNTYSEGSATFGDGSIADVYSNNLSCNYLIQPTDAVSIQLDFPEFFVEPGDTLYIYNGPSSTYPLYGKYSNDAIIPTINSTGGALYLVFLTNGDDVDYGWTASYTSVIGTPGCSGLTTLTSLSASFSDGSGILDYENNNNCTWLISPTDADEITLFFDSFNTQSGFDFVNVYDGVNEAGILLYSASGPGIPPVIIATSGNMFVKFTSDNSITSSGWYAHYTSTTIYEPPALLNAITDYEYWFDNNYVENISGSLGLPTINFNESIDVTDLNNGLHSFHIRFKDNNGLWSSVLTQFFVKTQMGVVENVINSGEYWFDNNYAENIDLLGINTETFSLNDNIDVNSLTNGLHSFHIRLKDANNLWSSVVTQFFIKTQSGVVENIINSGEYWFDNNYAENIDLLGINAETFSLNDNIDVNSLTNGLHSFHIRFKDANNLWSSVVTQFFIKTQTGVVENVINSGEYWFDNNYAGNIDLVGINAETFNFNENVDVNSLTNGLHSFHISFKDANNLWSSVLTQFFVKVPQITTPNLISTYEYWFDSDPYASAISVSLPTPINPYHLNDVVDVSALTEASHTIHFRFQDINGLWSSVVTDTFSREPLILADFTVSPISICAGASVTFDNLSQGATSYLWDFGDGTTSTAFEPTHIYSIGGSYTVTLTASNIGEGISDILTIPNAVTVIQPNPIITASGPTTFCSGSTVTLSTATGFTSYQWYRGVTPLAGATNSNYTTNKSGSYTVKVFQGTCFATSSATVVTVNPLPKATVSNLDATNDLCLDASIKLKANSGTGYTYQWYKGASMLAGATAQIYYATIQGNYKVKVTAATGCNKTSTSYSIIKTCKEEGEIESITQLTVFPNPNDGKYTLVFNSECNSELSVTIFDAVGRLILEDKGKIEDNIFSENYDLSGYAKGSYLVKVVCDEGAHYVNVVIQ